MRKLKTTAATTTATTTTPVRDRVLDSINQMANAFVARESAVRAMWIASLTGMNYLLVGEPGTAKTAVAKVFAKHVSGARLFAPSALGAYTTLGDLVGERDIPALIAGEAKRKTEGRLAESEFAFLDELFKASDSTMNTLLSLLNPGEREFEGTRTPLWSVGAATNWPEVAAMKPVVRAFWDRLTIRVVVEDVTSSVDMKRVIQAGRGLASYQPRAVVSYDELRAASVDVESVEVPDSTIDMLVTFAERLRAEKIVVSSRRLIQLTKLLQASAWLRGAKSTALVDFAVLRWCAWTKVDEIRTTDAVLTTLDAQLVRDLSGALASLESQAKRVANVDDAQIYLERAAMEVTRVADAIDGGMLTENGERDLRRSIATTETTVKTMCSRYGAQLGL